MRIESVNGVSPDDLSREERTWAHRREYRSSYRDTATASEVITAGEWFTAGDSLEAAGIYAKRGHGRRALTVARRALQLHVAACTVARLEPIARSLGAGAAALVEQASAASKNMQMQAEELISQVAFFRVGGAAARDHVPAPQIQSPSQVVARPSPLKAVTPKRALPARESAAQTGSAPLARASGDDSAWQEF